MTDFVIGIDPGASGALALFHTQTAELIDLRDMPYYEEKLTTGKRTKRINFEQLRIILETWKLKAIEQDANVHVHIEKVQGFSKQAATASFNFGYAAALPFAICKMLDFEVNLISPSTWKNQFGLKASEKDMARLLVLEMFPHLKPLLRFKYQVDRADAILISMYKPRL